MYYLDVLQPLLLLSAVFTTARAWSKFDGDDVKVYHTK